MQDDNGDSRLGRRSYLTGTAAVGAFSLGVANVSAGDDDDGCGDDQDDKKEKTTIEECGYTIDEPGYYVLEGDIEHDHDDHGAACIEITASDVTLDGRGHTMENAGEAVNSECPPYTSGTTGVLVRPADDGDHLSNVTVMDLTVMGFRTGIAFYRIKGGAIHDTDARDNYRGILLFKSHKSTVQNNDTPFNQQAGISLVDSGRNELTGNFALRSDSGISLDRQVTGSNDNTVADNIVRKNEEGIEVVGSNGNRLEANTAEENLGGIALREAKKNRLVANSANENNAVGIALTDANGNHLEENEANWNGGGSGADGTGIRLDDSHENRLKENVANENFGEGENDDGMGIHLDDSHQNRVTGNETSRNAAGPGGDGIGVRLWRSNGNHLEDNEANENGQNTADESRGIGIFLDNASENRLKANRTNRNGQSTPVGWGVRLFQSHENVISKHTANNNGDYGFYVWRSCFNRGSGNSVEDDRPPIVIVDGRGNQITINGAVYTEENSP